MVTLYYLLDKITNAWYQVVQMENGYCSFQKTTWYLARNRTLRSLLYQFALKMVDGNPEARPNINQVLEELAEMHTIYIKNKKVPKILFEEHGIASRLRR